MDPGFGLDQVRRSVNLSAGLITGRSHLDLNQTVRRDYGRSGYGWMVLATKAKWDILQSTWGCHGHPVCADGHTRTAMDVLCVLTDTHRRPVCADGHTQTHTDSHRCPVCADEQPQTATNVLCVLVDTHGRPVHTEQTAQVGQNHPNSRREGSAC
ncbi:hypothetical protein IGI04_004240 [Brassica rapa subsp. trilocularis]|uniref:Uncharacterized protein n=1 Tax=Brassica rapa subsp. trilocularis TaxID=1813537 RepID=A0ABQ7P0M6_BRACM|nr:hypothetical protein IGI04_004240 [Brassica rapa subsp. trilocularis]